MNVKHRIRPILFATLLLAVTAASAVADDAPRPWGQYVTKTLDTLIARGTDVYGPQETPMIMSVLDVNTLRSPENPGVYDRLIRLEGRIHRRGERGANLWNDQTLLRTMYAVAERSGDDKYRDAADAYVSYYLENCFRPNGLLYWGSHVHWDCYRDQPGGDGDGKGPHEILINECSWDVLYRINPEAVKREVDNIWKHHVHSKDTGRHNRHDYGHPGADFPFSGGSYVEAFSFMHRVTGDEAYLRQAKLVTDWHWRHRDQETNLVAFQPGNMLSEREAYHFYGSTFASAITGPHAARLLHSYELTGDEHFRDVAVAYLLAYDKYGWLEDKQTFVGMLNLDGTITTTADAPSDYHSQLPNQDKEPDPGYSVPPIGPVDMWPTTIYPLDFPLHTAQCAIYAYELTPEDDTTTREALLTMAKHWATAIEHDLPAHPGRTFSKTIEQAMPKVKETGGTYAGNYGRAISFFVHLYRATGNTHYLDVAEQIAGDAVDKLYVETTITEGDGTEKTWGIFKGHAAKPYYEAVDGVGLLLYALMELDKPDAKTGGAF